MIRRPARSLWPARPALRRVALLALVLYGLGAAAHVSHHLMDPECERTAASAPHACLTCHALHGGALSPAGAPALSSTAFASIDPQLPDVAAPAGITIGVRAARAPPRS